MNCADSIPDIPLAAPFVPEIPSDCHSVRDVESAGYMSQYLALQHLVRTLHTRFDFIQEGFFAYSRERSVLCSPHWTWGSCNGLASKMTVDTKAPWEFAFPEGELIWAYYNGWDRWQAGLVPAKDKIVSAIEQVYMYMALNGHRYGCLTTYDCTWFLKRADDASALGQSAVFVSPAIRCDSDQPYSLMAA
ncbi:hypothetical protein HDU91_004411, partial [Kappamyces sp. JEL0680]